MNSINDIEDNSNYKEDDDNNRTKIREIQIDQKMAFRQKKLNILGIEVYFPYEPYENQVLYMKKVIETLQHKGTAGLESPTGTGKTLCLLCASLAYLKHLREELINEKHKNNQNDSDNSGKNRQPVIYYTSRTHAQITNVIKELRKTIYRPINAVISSREQSCVNDYINQFKGGVLNLKCRYAKKKGECRYNRIKNDKVKGWSAYDGLTVDELKIKAKTSKFCPYYFEKDKSKNADLVFLPYNYIFDMKIFSRSLLILNNSILIIDEAHNLQDICCDSVSVDINTNVLDEIINDLKATNVYFEGFESNGGKSPDEIGPSKLIKTEDLKNEIHILNILKERIMNIKLEKKNVKNGQNPGIKLNAKEFFALIFKSYKGNQSTINYFNKTQTNQVNICENSYNEIKEENKESNENNEVPPELTWKNITKHISLLKDVEDFINNDRAKGTLISIYTDFLDIVNLISDNYYNNISEKDPLNLYVNSFRFYIEEECENNNNSGNKKKKKISFSNAKVVKRILHIYCFNPGVGFKAVLDHNLYSTIITSGTLSPIDSMESELKHNFDYKLENTHVISDEQFNFCVLTSSPDNGIEYNFNVDNRLNSEMIGELGLTILKFCEITKGGILVFFSSYSIMDKYISEWTQKQIISKITKYKEFYFDRRESRENKRIMEKYELANSDRKKYKGAILLSVCRGSCSEGMNFKDDMARLVIVIGIPYAMLYDPKVQLKKEFQDEFNKLLYEEGNNKNIKKLTGSEWYSQNALRCVNQALGRVIRHSNDYGAMVLIDTRYSYIVKKKYISLWMRNKCKIYYKNNTNSIYTDMKNFFDNVEDFIKNKKLNVSKNELNKNSKNNSLINNSKNNIKKVEKSSKMLNQKMNELENSKIDENGDKFIIYRSKKIKINEIKISDNKDIQKENPIKESSQKDLEGINLIDESYFNNLLSEEDASKNIEEEKLVEEEIENNRLIEEFMKKRNDINFLKELEKRGVGIKEKSENENDNISQLNCPVCFFTTKNSNIIFESGKCGHAICKTCWNKMENSEGIAICPICRKEVNKKERNKVYIS